MFSLIRWSAVARQGAARAAHAASSHLVCANLAESPDEVDASLPFQPSVHIERKKLKLYTRSQIPAVLNSYLGQSQVDPAPYMAAASVLPMRVNNYVTEQLIDWSDIPNDPIFQLVFPQPEMLDREDLDHVQDMLARNVSRTELRAAVEKVRQSLNPHPGQQKELNVPQVNGRPVAGMQHKYRETVLFFPSEGQYCQSFCTYCFRWAQFTAVGSDQQFQSTDASLLCDYLAANRCVSDVLFTGGDPMVMTARQLQRYLEPIVHDPRLDHVSTVRIGSKSLAYWPYRYVTDPDAADLLRLFETVVRSGRHLAFMAHFSHPRELSTPVVQEAVRLLQMAGVRLRSQAPLINHINDRPETWASMWRTQVRLGIIPYYMFVERDTGCKQYFEVPLARGVQIYSDAVSCVSGVARTVRGPSMSASPGKMHVLGTAVVDGHKVFVLKFLQARNPRWIDQVFFAEFDEKAAWFNDLKPAFGAEKFFFEDELAEFEQASTSSGAMFPYPPHMEPVNAVMAPGHPCRTG